MARKPLVTAHEPAPAIELKPDATNAANVMAVVQSNYDDDRDLMNQLLGQAQALSATSAMLQTFGVSKLAFVKENKLYQTLKGKSSPNGLELRGTWEEFCSLLGMSDEKVNQDIANLRSFGEDALESMSRMGIGYRELRQFRKLPDDQKTALIEVAKSGDKDSFLDLAEEIIARHSKEKEELTSRAEEAEADLEARSRLLSDRDEKIQQLTKANARIKKQAPADIGEEIRKEAVQMASEAEVGIRAMKDAFDALVDHTEEFCINHEEFMSGLVCQLELALRQLRGNFDLKDEPDGEEVPGWIRETEQVAG